MNDQIIDTASDRTSIYATQLQQYRARLDSLRESLGWMSFLRLLLFCGFAFLIYSAISSATAWAIIGSIICLAGFLSLIRVYDRMEQQTNFYRALVRINEDEIAFLNSNKSSYPAGEEYIDPHHAYSFDLDLFGDGGLYPYLNRCSTSFGKDALAKLLLDPQLREIHQRQEAVLELRGRLEFRQHLQAHGSLLDTKKREMQQLRAWLATPPGFAKPILYYLLSLFPLVSLGALIFYFATENDAALNLFYGLFVFNIFIAAAFARKIAAQLSVSTSVTKILQQFAGQLRQLEQQQFDTAHLKGIQQRLRTAEVFASASLARLASLFNYLETVVNLVVSMLLNGLFLFHLHILFALEKWKRQHGDRILPWLATLGEVEALNSLANQAYNNRDHCMPAISSQEILATEGLGHPLIRPGKRIENSISFSDHRFVILTGSNMSGKSTFLRTLGINLVLARAGGVVCARQFTFFPFAVRVSMRISDSLQDSESFFYAELKRLQSIIQDIANGEKVFIILDEILRGTNSDDKHNGTIGLIHKLVSSHACGIIATHDLTVSKLADQFPGYISNKCFESEIVNDELLFDYRLKDGVCTKLSASFLMKKMNIIE